MSFVLVDLRTLGNTQVLYELSGNGIGPETDNEMISFTARQYLIRF
jgi:hypothetical protein